MRRLSFAFVAAIMAGQTLAQAANPALLSNLYAIDIDGSNVTVNNNGMVSVHGTNIAGTSGTAYAGPCDIASCGAAYSVTRAMTASYTGPLFQLIRASDHKTLDVGQVNHTADMTVEVPFCAQTTCSFSVLYDQIGETNLTPPVNTGGFTPTLCSAVNVCAPPYFVDTATGLPIIRTPYPTMLYNETNVGGVVGGSGPISVVWYGRTDGWSSCCGLFGASHPARAVDTAGTDFIPGLGYSTGNPFVNCTSAGTVCAQVDIEQFTQGPNYTPATSSDMFNAVTFDGVAATNTITQYVNSGTSSYTGTALATMNVGNTVRLGGGGDLSHVDGVFREGLISNVLLPSNRVTALLANVTAFYSARVPDTCQGSGDFGYFWAGNAGGQGSNPGVSSALAAYSLRRMSASYTGPIADLTDAVGTTRTFGPSRQGCFISRAATQFCAANSPCKVSKLYNQAAYTTQNNFTFHDTAGDLIQATSAAQPTVKFGGLNGLPTMVFAGAQSLCTPPIQSVTGSPITFMSFVAKRTGSFTAFGEVIASSNSPSDGLAFNSSANTVIGFFGTSIVGAATDGVFHAIAWEAVATTASATTLYAAGASLATGTQSAYRNYAQPAANSKTCLGVNGSAANFLTGEIAEALVANTGSPTAPTPSVVAAVYAGQLAVWGVAQ